MICADTELSSLDKRMFDLFSLAVTQAGDRSDVQKLQKRWLRDRDDCKEVPCLKATYEARLEQLAALTGRLPVKMVQTMCARLQSADTRGETLSSKDGATDINNDGKPESETNCAGTGNVPCAAYLDADNRPIHIQQQGFELSTYAPLARTAFRYENLTFVYHSRDAALAEPAYVSYITPTNRELRICEYDTHIGSAVVEGGDDVCAAVEANERIEPIEWTDAEPRSLALERADTAPKSIAAVDIDNDGLDENVAELSYQSSAGDGCVFNYFELLTEDRRRALNNSNSIPVRDLQGLQLEAYRGRDCGKIENRLFKFEDKVFYETNVGNSPGVPHEVRVLDGTAVATLCTFERQVSVRLKQLRE